MEMETPCEVPHPQGLHRSGGHRVRRRDLRQRLAVRPPELERAVGLSIDLVALLVDRAVVTATEQRESRERRRAALRPVAEVLALTEWQPTAREAAALVPIVERSS
jgi:hypothetical protein